MEIPYPPVFRDWINKRAGVATVADNAGVGVEMSVPMQPSVWQRVVLTEDDACLLAASLLDRAGQRKLSRKVLKKLTKEAKK